MVSPLFDGILNCPMPFRCLMIFVSLLIPWNGLAADEGALLPGRNLELLDLSGKRVNPFGDSKDKAIVFVFTSNTCPIANRYAPELQRLEKIYRSRGVAFWLVHADSDETTESIGNNAREHGYRWRVLRDPKQKLVRLAKARVTPEAALFSPGGELLYHGRIDDRYVAFGQARREPTSRDLQKAIEAVLAGKPVAPSETKAIGCYIPERR